MSDNTLQKMALFVVCVIIGMFVVANIIDRSAPRKTAPAPTCHCRCCNDSTPTLPNPFNPSPDPDKGIVLPNASGTVIMPSDWTDQPGITIPLAAEDRP